MPDYRADEINNLIELLDVNFPEFVNECQSKEDPMKVLNPLVSIYQFAKVIVKYQNMFSKKRNPIVYRLSLVNKALTEEKVSLKSINENWIKEAEIMMEEEKAAEVKIINGPGTFNHEILQQMIHHVHTHCAAEVQ